MKKKILKVVIYLLTVIHIFLLIGIFYYDSKNNFKPKIKQVLIEKTLYDSKPLVLKVDKKAINISSAEIETGKILLIEDSLIFNIEDTKVYYVTYDEFLLLIFNDNSQLRLVFIDSNCNVLKDLKKVSYNSEIFDIENEDAIKLYKDKIILEMKSNKFKINYQLKWKDNIFYEDINMLK